MIDMKISKLWIAGLAALVLFSTAAFAHKQSLWIGTWQSSPTGLSTALRMGTYTFPAPATAAGTIRYRLRISQGGTQIRIRLSNEYSEKPLMIQAVSVGLAGEGLDASPGTLRRATFAGKNAITLPAGAPALTDPIDLPVKPLS